jgi:hypothetical protein
MDAPRFTIHARKGSGMKRFAMVVGIMGVLAGCAPQQAVQSPEELRGTHGFVHATLLRGLQGVTLKGAADHTLRRQPENGATAFGLWVPAGEYDVEGLVARDGSRYTPVTVVAGRMTDLGGLARMEIGGYENVTLPIRHPELDAERQKALQALRPHLRDATPIEWRPTAPPAAVRPVTPPTNLGLIADLITLYERERNKPPLNAQLKQAATIEEFYRGAVSVLPPATDEPASDAAGNLYYGAELGQVRMRSRDGQWSTLDTGTIQAVMAVEASGNLLVAGTAAGELRVSSDRKTWRRAAALPADEAVVDIDRFGKRWIVLGARMQTRFAGGPYGGAYQTAEVLRVYSTTSDDLGGLALLREVQLTEPWLVFLGRTPRGQGAGNAYYVTSVAEMLKLDLATLQWTTLPNPGHGMHGFHVAKNGLVTAYRNQGIFSKINLSTDQGATWRPAETPPYPFYDVAFEAPDKGLATRFAMGAFSSTIEFLEFDATQNKWQKTHEAPGGCARLLRDADNVQRYCLTTGNSILNYVGGKWLVEAAVN